MVIELVEEGSIPESRLDESVRRILRDKFRLGLFDNPYVDEDNASSIAGRQDFRKKGFEAQQKSTVLLKNDGLLPLKKGTKIYIAGTENTAAYEGNGAVVDNPDEADVVVLRIWPPFEERSDYFLESFFKQGRLYYSEEEMGEILPLIADKPSVVIANLNRPTILTEIDANSQAMIGEFGTSDEAMAEILFGQAEPAGKLPFELPFSWEAVLEQFEDTPYDSKDLLYKFGHGLEY